jgi:hypothetical protein
VTPHPLNFGRDVTSFVIVYGSSVSLAENMWRTEVRKLHDQDSWQVRLGGNFPSDCVYIHILQDESLFHHNRFPIQSLLSSSFPSNITFSASQLKFINMQLITPLIAATLLASNVIAHPGHDIRAEMAERAAFMQTSKRDLSHCAAKMKARGMDKRTISRRAAVAEDARKNRSIAAGKSFLSRRKRQLTNLN